MRYVLAIVSLAISGVLLLLGIGQRTFLAGPSEIVYSLAADETASYAVLDVSELEKVNGQANIVTRGETAFTALANTRDAEAWLEPFDHIKLTVDPATKELVQTPVRGEEPKLDLLDVDDEGKVVPIDPRGSDLWLTERVGGEAGTRLAVEPAAEQSIIIAGADAGPIPNGAAVVWVQDRATPLAGPLLAGGGLFAALGAVLYLIAFDRDKRALGPRRGRKGPLLGVRNVFTGSKSRGRDDSGAAGAPKRGSLENTPDAAAIGVAGAAGGAAAEAGAADAAPDASAPDASAQDAEEIVTAEVVAEEADQPGSADITDADIADADIADVDPIEVDPIEVVAIEDGEIDDDETTVLPIVELDDSQVAAAEAEAAEAEAEAEVEDIIDVEATKVDGEAVADADDDDVDPAAKKGDDHAE